MKSITIDGKRCIQLKAWTEKHGIGYEHGWKLAKSGRIVSHKLGRNLIYVPVTQPDPRLWKRGKQ